MASRRRHAFVLEVNSEDIESIKSVPGVKSVTVDKIHWERVYNDDSYVLLGDGDADAVFVVLGEGLYGVTLGVNGDACAVDAGLAQCLGHVLSALL